MCLHLGTSPSARGHRRLRGRRPQVAPQAAQGAPMGRSTGPLAASPHPPLGGRGNGAPGTRSGAPAQSARRARARRPRPPPFWAAMGEALPSGQLVAAINQQRVRQPNGMPVVYSLAIPKLNRIPLCDTPSGCYSFTGPWTVTRSSLRMLRRVAAFCRPLRLVLLLVSFPRSRSPVVGVPGLCWMWHGVPFAHQRRPIVGVLRLCWLLPGSFDCFCCPRTSVLRPSTRLNLT